MKRAWQKPLQRTSEERMQMMHFSKNQIYIQNTKYSAIQLSYKNLKVGNF